MNDRIKKITRAFFPKSRYYTLDGHEPVPCGSCQESKRIKRTNVDGHLVSTVFFPVDHGHSDDEDPILFETMVFSREKAISGSEESRYTRRYSTWDEAVKGHDEVVLLVKEEIM